MVPTPTEMAETDPSAEANVGVDAVVGADDAAAVGVEKVGIEAKAAARAVSKTVLLPAERVVDRKAMAMTSGRRSLRRIHSLRSPDPGRRATVPTVLSATIHRRQANRRAQRSRRIRRSRADLRSVKSHGRRHTSNPKPRHTQARPRHHQQRRHRVAAAVKARAVGIPAVAAGPAAVEAVAVDLPAAAAGRAAVETLAADLAAAAAGPPAAEPTLAAARVAVAAPALIAPAVHPVALARRQNQSLCGRRRHQRRLHHHVIAAATSKGR